MVNGVVHAWRMTGRVQGTEGLGRLQRPERYHAARQRKFQKSDFSSDRAAT